MDTYSLPSTALTNTREPQGVGIRLVATIIDFIVIVIGTFIFSMFFGTARGSSFSVQGLSGLVLFFLILGYHVIMEWKYGATVGKLAVGLRVVMLDGSRETIAAAIIRTIMRIIDSLFLYLVAVIAVSASVKKQRLGDMVAGTIVIKK